MPIAKTSLKIFAGTLLVVGGLITVTSIAVQTEFATRQISDLVTRLTAQTAMPVTLQNVRGNLLSDLHIAHITVADRDGIWLRISNLHVGWNPSVLFRSSGTLVDVITADQIIMERKPVTDQEVRSVEKNSKPVKMPRWSEIKRFLPGRINIARIIFKEAVTNHAEQELGITSMPKGDHYQILIYTRQGPVTLSRLQMDTVTDKPNMQLVVKEEAGGVIGRLVSQQDTEIMASVKLIAAADETVKLDRLFAQIGTFSIYGTGSWQTQMDRLDGKVTLMAPDLGLLQGLMSEPLAGSLHAVVALHGSLENLETTLQARSPALIWSDKTLSDFTLDVASQFNAKYLELEQLAGQIDIKAAAILDTHPLALDGHLDARDGTIKANIRHAAYSPYALSGTGYYHADDQEFEIQAITDALELHALLPQTTMAGTLQSTVDAKGSVKAFDFRADNKIQTPHGNSKLVLNGEVDQEERSLALQADGTFVHDKKNFTLQSKIIADPSLIKVDMLQVNGPGVQVDGQGYWDVDDMLAQGQLTFDVPDLQPLGQLVGMSLKGAIQLEADATAKNKQQIIHANLKKLDLPVGDKQSIRLQKPATLAVEQREARLSPLTVFFSGGSITAEGTATEEAIDATFKARGLSLHQLVDTIPEGKADASVRITGTPKAPIVALTGNSSVTQGDIPITLSVNGNWRERNLSLVSRVNAKKATLVANTDLDAGLSLMPFKTDISEKTPLKGNVTAHMSLNILDPFLWAGGHRVNGMVDGQASLAGRIGQPQFNGAFTVKDARYDHIDSGICLRRVNGVVRLSNDAVRLQNLTARDNEDHILAANLRLALTDAKPFDGHVTMDRFRLFCGGVANGNIDGRIGASGTMDRMQMGGRLTLGPLNVQIPGAQTDETIPSVKIERQKSKDTVPPIVALNIAVNAPNQIFVRGRGLDAEFGGNLNVTGFANQPVIGGQFASRRGSFTLLDRKLKLNKAELRFAGAIPPSPFLTVDASTKVKDTEVTVDLSGSALKPALTLSSNPVRPQDEVLALLLFGRQLQTISPFQAIKLAQAARTLAGLDGGEPGILDKARNVLGLDALNIGTADDNSMTVSTGKYITDRVYVEVQEGARPEDKQIKTQIELTPAISGSTTIDGNANQGVGLGWRHDY